MQNFKHAQARHLLRSMIQAAVDAAQPALCLPKHLPPPPAGRTIVIGAGKASAAMASALERHWQGRKGLRMHCEPTGSIPHRCSRVRKPVHYQLELFRAYDFKVIS